MDLATDRAVDPDAQAAVTDFLDYTEYLPSDLIRSLTLIQGLDDTYLSNSYAVHDLTKVYGSLPSLEPSARPNVLNLRSQISSHLDQALNARESAYAEACRLFDVAERHQNRLKSILAKLQAIPKPPSRDPTPQPPSSEQKRPRSGRKLENGVSTTRLTLNPPRGGTVAAAILSRPRGRRVTVPGEVMPPFDPDEAIASTEVSDWDSPPPPSPPRPILKLKQPKPLKDRLPLSEKPPRAPREQIVSYRKPTPPPEDAELGSKHRPWTHLTEYEMYRLRKKMKKNHNWEPSEVMIRRELAERGRGWDNYYKAKAEAKANGIKFVDIDDVSPIKPDKTQGPTPTPGPAQTPRSKSVKKPDPRQDKKDDTARDKAALAAQEAELAARRLGDIGSAFKNLFSPLSNALASLNRSASSPSINMSASGKKPTAVRNSRKRKLDDVAISTSPSAEPDLQNKRQKTAPKPSPLAASEPPPAIISAGTIRIPLKLNVTVQPSERSEVSTPASTTRSASTRKLSVAPKLESTPDPIRPPSRRSAASSLSAEPAIAQFSRTSRRTSTTPAMGITRKTPAGDTTPKMVQTAASRRSKREAPGTVMQSSQDGGAAVSVSKRKTKPAKVNKATQAVKPAADVVAPQIRVDVDGRQELVDPDEERYCICGDVSWGEMICCELDEKCEYGQWFHMECVHLVELPPRTVKWYCPGDRKKHHKGETSNGLVGRGIK